MTNDTLLDWARRLTAADNLNVPRDVADEIRQAAAVRRPTCLGDLPIDVNTVDRLDKEVTDLAEISNRLRRELAEARSKLSEDSGALAALRSERGLRGYSNALRVIARALDPEGDA